MVHRSAMMQVCIGHSRCTREKHVDQIRELGRKVRGISDGFLEEVMLSLKRTSSQPAGKRSVKFCEDRCHVYTVSPMPGPRQKYA